MIISFGFPCDISHNMFSSKMNAYIQLRYASVVTALQPLKNVLPFGCLSFASLSVGNHLTRLKYISYWMD